MEKEITSGIFVMPGDPLGSEEEFLPSSNTFLDGANICASVAGNVRIDKGEISVEGAGRHIRKLSRGDSVIGTVVGEMKSVLFIKIDRIKANGITIVPAKDGKIPIAMGGRSFHGRERSHSSSHADEKAQMPQEKLCGLGDVVLSKVIREEEDIYILGLSENELGIIHSFCEACGGELSYKNDTLTCSECDMPVHKKISTMYDNSDQIKAYFARNINFGR